MISDNLKIQTGPEKGIVQSVQDIAVLAPGRFQAFSRALAMYTPKLKETGEAEECYNSAR